MSRFSKYMLLSVVTLLLISNSSAFATTLPDGFAETRLPYNLAFPSSMAIAPDGRVFVGERSGALRVFKNDVLLQTPFLVADTDSSGERGLVGIAFDPDFATNGYIYIYYTAKTPTIHNRVSRFTANGDVAVPGSEVILLELDDLVSNQHNGGGMQFGSDGKLYIGVGDNFESTNAQTLANLKGKVLRINRDGSIPDDNPFYNSAAGKNKAIWALGLRNPFTLDIQRGTGRIFLNEVGHLGWEEIDEGAAGANYGWPDTEGYTSDPRYKTPAYAYSHGDGKDVGCAITGGVFYNPLTPQFPSEYVGQYFFIDYCNRWIRTFDPASNLANSFATDISVGNTIYLDVSPDGSLYYMTTADQNGRGAVFKIKYTGNLAPQIGTQPASQTVSVGYTATFSIDASGYKPLSYQWQRNGENIPGATESSYTTPSLSKQESGVQFRCVVSNSFGTATSDVATLTVTTDLPPTATITSPPAETLYKGGDTIFYEGFGSDPETGELPPSAFTWRVDFLHAEHFHPFVPPTTGSKSGSFIVPTVGETAVNVKYRIYLTVTDSAGLSHTSYHDVLPMTSTITLATNPAGLLVTLDGQPQNTPVSAPGVVGVSRTIGVISPQKVNGIVYEFDSWSDGGAATHSIQTPAADSTYTANFRIPRTGTISATPNPIQVCDGSGLGVTTINWNSTQVSSVEVRIGSPSGSLLARSGAGSGSATTGKWVSNGMVFYLQDVSSGLPLTAANTLATVTVNTTSNGCSAITGSISATPNPVQVCDGSGLGVVTLNWNSTGTRAVEVRVGSPSGSLFARSGTGSVSATTGKWVGNNTIFYLQDVSGGLPLSSANTLATVTVGVTTAGCRVGSIVANPNPIEICDNSGNAATTLTWNSTGPALVEVRIGSPSGSLFARSGTGAWSATTGKWVKNNMVFYLQDVSGGLPLTSANTLATITVNVVKSNRCGSISATPNPIQVCDGTGLGITTLTWSSTGTSIVEVRIGSPTGKLFSRSSSRNRSATTGKWVSNGMVFYLQDVSGGLPLTAANTLATVTVNTTSNGCVAATQQPKVLTIPVSTPTTFMARATDAYPFRYQWQRRSGINLFEANHWVAR
jgi:glucose/arabinose dehydrogenase